MASDIIYLLVYVDDILLTRSNSTLIAKLILLLSLEFKLRDLISIHYFLGIEVKLTSVGVMLTQHKYALNILPKICMSSCKPIDTQISLSPSKLAMIYIDLYSTLHAIHKLLVLLQVSILCFLVLPLSHRNQGIKGLLLIILLKANTKP